MVRQHIADISRAILGADKSVPKRMLFLGILCCVLRAHFLLMLQFSSFQMASEARASLRQC